MITSEERIAWERDGYFIRRGFVAPEIGRAMEEALVASIHADPPSMHLDKPAYRTAGDLLIMPEAKPNPHARAPEDTISKVFNTHLSGPAQTFAHDAACGDIVSSLLGADIDVFQSQFILKNPGAWGQPWHQDSFYFPFDQQPQVGLWLAISEATLENGCLSVLPGSHTQPIHAHDADDRPGANQGYLEIRDHDMTGAVPVLMQPGDLLVFHSYLMHRSEDNRARARRSAMVYHYSVAGVQPIAPLTPAQKMILQWRPVVRNGAPAPLAA